MRSTAVCCGLLDQVRLQYRRKRGGFPIRDVLILHDKAKLDTAGLMQHKLVKMHWKTLDHPPYSPDLSPCDFHMFGPLKEAFEGKRFETNDQVETFVCNWFDTGPNSFYENEMEKLPKRWEKCVIKGGDYVEK